MVDNKKYVKLLWYGKFVHIKLGQSILIEIPNLLLQVVEIINKPRLKDLEVVFFDLSKFYPENKFPPDFPKNWESLFIWSDNKLVISSLLKKHWFGKTNLISLCYDMRNSIYWRSGKYEE